MVDSDTKVPFNEAAFACIDFETTGFSQKSDRVLEVAVVIVQQGQIGDIWTTLINPGDGKALGASHVHGIRKEWLFQAPSFAEIAGFGRYLLLPIRIFFSIYEKFLNFVGM